MKNLDELYKIREMLHANGMEMSSEQLEGLNEAEEEYIRTELTTAIKKAVGSALEKIQRPFDIVVHHRPDKELELDIIQLEENKSVEDGEPNAEDNAKEKAVRKARRKSVGFSVAFPDGTVYHESQAVETFILALKKIGFERIASDPGVPQHVGYSVVSEYERKADKTVQRQVDGYYIYTNLGNDVKIDDLQDLSKRYNLGLTITLDEDSENGEIQPVVDRHLPTIDWESYRYT